MSTCRGCGAEIEWVRTKDGRSMPVDPERIEIVAGLHVDARGDRGQRQAVREVTVVTDHGRVVRGTRVADLEPGLMRAGLALLVTAGRVPHWATCPKADRFRAKSDAERER